MLQRKKADSDTSPALKGLSTWWGNKAGNRNMITKGYGALGNVQSATKLRIERNSFQVKEKLGKSS